jgi:hypothetical protein
MPNKSSIPGQHDTEHQQSPGSIHASITGGLQDDSSDSGSGSVTSDQPSNHFASMLPIHRATHVHLQYHPASSLTDEIIPVDEYFASRHDKIQVKKTEDGKIHWKGRYPPWYPFHSQADFNFAEYCILKKLTIPDIKELLHRHHESWSGSSNLSFKKAEEVTLMLNCAKLAGVPVSAIELCK